MAREPIVATYSIAACDLEAGRPLDEFLDDFPSVSRHQAVAALEDKVGVKFNPIPFSGAAGCGTRRDA